MFALWLGFAGIAMSSDGPPSLHVQVLEASSYVLCCTAGCIFMLAVFVRFANRPVRVFDALGDKAYGIYLVHYLFSVWLQFVLLGLAVTAIVKAAIVFAGTLVLSWGLVTAIRQASSAIGIISPARHPLPTLPRIAGERRDGAQTNRGTL